jgi:hypothetical protein
LTAPREHHNSGEEKMAQGRHRVDPTVARRSSHAPQTGAALQRAIRNPSIVICTLPPFSHGATAFDGEYSCDRSSG